MTSSLLHRLDDDRLVALTRGGSDAAFAAIHDRYRARLLACARAVLRGTGADPEDVVQDAMVRAARALPASHGPMRLSAWLHTIVRNCALDELRRPHRANFALELNEATAHRDAPEFDPVKRAVAREELAGLVAAIGELPLRQRRALVLREFAGAGHDDIAANIGTSAPAVKALISRARSAVVGRVAIAA